MPCKRNLIQKNYYFPTVPRPVHKNFPINHQIPAMSAPTFHGGQAVNHSHEIQPPGLNPIYGQTSFGSHNLQATQTAVLGVHNLYIGNTSPHSNSTNFNFNIIKPIQQPNKSLENVMENSESNNINSPTRKTSHNFTTKPNSSDCERQKSVSATLKNERSPKVLAENVGIPFHEEISLRSSTADPHKMHREVKAPKLPAEQEDIPLSCILNTPELPPKIHLGQKAPGFARGSSDTLFHFDPQRIHRVNNTSQDGNS